MAIELVYRTDLTERSPWVMEIGTGNGFLVKDENLQRLILESCKDYGSRLVTRRDFKERYILAIIKSVPI